MALRNVLEIFFDSAVQMRFWHWTNAIFSAFQVLQNDPFVVDDAVHHLKKTVFEDDFLQVSMPVAVDDRPDFFVLRISLNCPMSSFLVNIEQGYDLIINQSACVRVIDEIYTPFRPQPVT